ncbi:MAG: 4Fe-4S dicluster domain-containing protein, partial [Rhizobiales bacterium]|nr:4Fe-4S dicluster domain-containing protein [Hyphomicrobiales bacterium]
MSRLLPDARWHHYSPLFEDNRRTGAIAAFGRPVDCVYNLTQADAIVMLGGDLFAAEPGHIRYAADYQARRRAEGRPLPRLVAVESCPSLVGARADERLHLRPSEIEVFAQSLGSALGIIAASAKPHPDANRLAAELHRAGPRGLVVAGREQPERVHALAHAVNVTLGALGTTMGFIDPGRPLPAGEVEAIAALAEAIAAGSVSHLLVLGGNPAYDAPADLDLAALIARVPLSVHLGTYRNETADACRWHVPQCHPLEAFGDLRAFDGTVGLCQPATVRLEPSLSLTEALGLLAGENGDELSLVQATWRQAWGEPFETRWARALEDGVVPDSAFRPTEVALRPEWNAGAGASQETGIEVVFAADPCLWDGRFANNGWLQELPKPLTKQVWGNAALIAPETAEALRVSTGEAVEVAVGERSIQAPVWVLPGHAPGAVTLPLGFGRTAAGALGDGIGFNAYLLRTTQHPWSAPARLTPMRRRVELVTTQHHHALEGRDIVRIFSPGQPATESSPPHPSFYPEWLSEGHAWGMAIDLDACIGCNSCVIACQAENNVAVVGPEQVAKGREMHWLRVDRYHAGDPATPETYFQPVPCMHCEQAPCEVVCPVNATVHSSEGLNDMVYNRCIGTRTCSNNCPYKVRRFNFLDNRETEFAAPRDAFNPQVTVRSRGVMEKCTYCVQRISAARIFARIEERAVSDGEVVTACQQACPTQAIAFGDVSDPASAVGRLKASPRNYALLGELNTRPRTTYLARVESTEAPGGE